MSLAKHPAASPPRPTAPRWLNTCPDLGISAGVAFNLLGGKSASRLGTRTSFCVVSPRTKPLPPPNGLGWRRAGACGEAGWGRPPGPPYHPSTGRLNSSGCIVGWPGLRVGSSAGETPYSPKRARHVHSHTRGYMRPRFSGCMLLNF